MSSEGPIRSLKPHSPANGPPGQDSEPPRRKAILDGRALRNDASPELDAAIPAVRVPRMSRKRVVQSLVVVALLAGAWIWFRDSQFVAVNNVRIAGVRG